MTKIKTTKDRATKRITYVLDKLGMRYSRHGDLLQACCPCHQHEGDGDNATAFSWRLDIGRWVCWTHHCEQAYGNDVFGLVRSILETPFNETVDWVHEVLDNEDAECAIDVEELRAKKKSGTIHAHKSLSDKLIKFLCPNNPPSELIADGFRADVLREYEVGYWSRLGTFMHDRFIFPVRDVKGDLVGFTGRTIHKDYKERGIKSKWLHARRYDKFPRPNDLQTGSILYNLFKAKDHLGPEKAVIIVEGPKDVLKLVQAGILNVVATLGTGFGPSHRSLLVNLGVNVIYMAYDPDKAGHDGEERIEEIVGDLIEIRYINLQDEDPGEMSEEKAREIFPCISNL